MPGIRERTIELARKVTSTLDAPRNLAAPNAARKRSIPYNAALDGVRAIAIIAVVIFHISPAALAGGFVGVDIFFVLSGFLMTSILIKGLGTSSMREFYLRRIQRLLPNLILMVLTVLFIVWLFLPPSSVHQNAKHSLWAMFNLSNIYVWRYLGGYWGDSAEFSALTHTWSLGIEEQFYLCFPACLLLLARFQPTRLRFWLTLAAFLSFTVCLYGSYRYPSATFYLLPTRVWELLLGGILASYQTPLQEENPTSTSLAHCAHEPNKRDARSECPRPLPLGREGQGEGCSFPSLQMVRRKENRSPRSLRVQTRESLGWLGLGIIGIGFSAAGADIAFPGWLSLFPTLGTVLLLISVADGKTAVSRLLSNRFMVETGRLSYSLYLWHWPLITIGKIQADLHGLPQLAGAAAGGLMAILFAWGAYVYVEKPLRNRGPGRWRRLRIIACGFSFAVLVSGILASRRVLSDPLHRFDPVIFSAKLYNAGPIPAANEADTVAYSDVVFPPVPPRPVQPWRTGGLVHPYGGDQPKVVVLGSSHAMMYSQVIDEICRESRISVAFLGADAGTPAFFEAWSRHSFASQEEANEFDEARRKYLRVWHPELVFVIDRWDRVATSGKAFQQGLRTFLSEVAPLAGRIILVPQVPAHRGGNHVNLREIVHWMSPGNALPKLFPDSKEKLRREIATIAEAATADFPNLHLLRADLSFYNPDGSIRFASGRTFFYADDNHLSDAGSELVRPLFQKAITDAQISSPRPTRQR